MRIAFSFTMVCGIVLPLVAQNTPQEKAKRRIKALFEQLKSEDWLKRKDAIEQLAKEAEKHPGLVEKEVDRRYRGADVALKEELNKLCKRIGYLAWGVLDVLMRRIFGADGKDSAQAQQELFCKWFGAGVGKTYAWKAGLNSIRRWLKKAKLAKPALTYAPHILHLGQKQKVVMKLRANGQFLAPRGTELEANAANYRLLGLRCSGSINCGLLGSAGVVIGESGEFSPPPFVLVRNNASFSLPLPRTPAVPLTLTLLLNYSSWSPLKDNYKVDESLQNAEIDVRQVQLKAVELVLLPPDEGYKPQKVKGVTLRLEAPDEVEAGKDFEARLVVANLPEALKKELRAMEEWRAAAWCVAASANRLLAEKNDTTADEKSGNLIFRFRITLKEKGTYKLYSGVTWHTEDWEKVYMSAPMVKVRVRPPALPRKKRK